MYIITVHKSIRRTGNDPLIITICAKVMSTSTLTLYLVILYILVLSLKPVHKSPTRTMSLSLEDVRYQKGFKLVHLNARSLLHHFDEISVSFLDGCFDVVICTESWLHANCASSLIHVQGYCTYRLDRHTINHSGGTKRGGGIIVYVKEGIKVSEWPNLDVSDEDLLLECISLTCKQGMRRNVNLTAVYRPPTGRVQSVIDRLEALVETIRLSTSGDTVVIGDLNVDLLADNLQSRKLKQFTNSCRLDQIIEEPTRITPTSETLIDHVYSNISHVKSVGALNCFITDHLPIVLVIKKSKLKQQFRQIYTRSYRDFDKQSFSEDIRNLDFEESFTKDEPNEIWNSLFVKFCQVIDAHCPMRTIKIKIGKPKYLTDRILTLMRERDRAFREVRKHKTPDNWQLARILRARVARELRLARKEYILAQLHEANGDGKKFWRTIHTEFFNKLSPPITSVFDESNQNLVDGTQAADMINRFFCNISTKLSSKFSAAPTYDIDLLPAVHCNSIPRLSVRRVSEQIKLIDPNKSSGFKNIPAKLLKIILELIPEHFTSLNS